jgi:hypothetical protein
MLEENKPLSNIDTDLKPKKSKEWIFKLILILIVVGVVYYFFKNPEGIQSWVNNFFGKLLK